MLTLLRSEWPKPYGVLAILSAIGLNSSKSVTNRIKQKRLGCIWFANDFPELKHHGQVSHKMSLFEL